MGVQHWAMLEPRVAPPLLKWVVKGQVTPEHVGVQHLPAAVAARPRWTLSALATNAWFIGQETEVEHMMGAQHSAVLAPGVDPNIMVWVAVGQAPVHAEHGCAQHLVARPAIGPASVVDAAAILTVGAGQVMLASSHLTGTQHSAVSQFVPATSAGRVRARANLSILRFEGSCVVCCVGRAACRSSRLWPVRVP
jgi:hypothetical protein